VTFENVSINGQKLTRASERVQVGEHTDDLRFDSDAP